MRRFSLAVSALMLVLVAGCPPAEHVPTDGGGQDPVACGPSTCDEGQVCCNESCGICTPPGGACTEQFCGDPGDDLCATVRCPADTHCRVTEIQCITTPCDPIVECVPNPGPTCDEMTCDPGAHCELVDVQCITEPCDPVPSCVADEECKGPVVDCAAPPPGCDYEGGGCVNGQWTCGRLVCPPDVAGCELIDCAPGFTCIEDERGAGSCVPEGASSCAATLCPEDTYCDDISGRAQCIPLPSCNTVRCKSGQHCELTQVQCIRAPCPPQPSCVDDEPECGDPCATVRCGSGTHCEAVEVQCVTTPCCPVAECAANEPAVKCGNNTCVNGDVCCNASCGICTPPGSFCIQLACPAGK